MCGESVLLLVGVLLSGNPTNSSGALEACSGVLEVWYVRKKRYFSFFALRAKVQKVSFTLCAKVYECSRGVMCSQNKCGCVCARTWCVCVCARVRGARACACACA